LGKLLLTSFVSVLSQFSDPRLLNPTILVQFNFFFTKSIKIDVQITSWLTSTHAIPSHSPCADLSKNRVYLCVKSLLEIVEWLGLCGCKIHHLLTPGVTTESMTVNALFVQTRESEREREFVWSSEVC
jgi:hypothetical protein